MEEITQDLIKNLFNYKDGILYWKNVNPNRFVKNGDKAGTFNKSNKYYNIKINNKSYLSHRLIFLYHHDFLPEFIDHIDSNKLNNNIENLRPATKTQNAMNRKLYKNKSSQYKGVAWHKRDKIWMSYIGINGKLKHLGQFDDEWTAAFIYNVYARGLFGEYANLNNLGE